MDKKISLFIGLAFVLNACATGTLVPMPTVSSESAFTATPEIVVDRPGWDLIWSDEFDGEELDRSNWNFDIGGNGWGNASWQAYTDSPQNIHLEDGTLVVTALEDPSLPAGRPYSSARIKTEGLHAWQYGRFEARIKLPQGQGIWPAFWMMGDNDKGWPASGEIDIMDFVGRLPDQIHATVHAPGYSGAKGVGSSITLSAETLQNDFHIYAVEWEQDEIRWYVDDQEFFKLTSADVPDTWIFDHPFFIALNLAVGGTWPGYPNDTTVFPQQMLVDYVRVYQR